MILTQLGDVARAAIHASLFGEPQVLTPYTYQRLPDEVQLAAGKDLFRACMRTALGRFDLEGLANERHQLLTLLEYGGDDEALLSEMRRIEDQITLVWHSPAAEVLQVLCKVPSTQKKLWSSIVTRAVTNSGELALETYSSLFHEFEQQVGNPLDCAPWPVESDWMIGLTEQAVVARFLEPLDLCPGCVATRLSYPVPNGVIASRYFYDPELPPVAIRVKACRVCNRFHHDMEAAEACFDDPFVHVAREGGEVVIGAYPKGAARHVVDSFDDGSDEQLVEEFVAAAV